MKTKTGLQLKDIFAGAAAGFLATFPMTASMQAIRSALPIWERHSLPPHKITMRMARRLNVRKYFGPRKSKVATALSHFGYGAASGALYGSFSPRVPSHYALSGTLFGLAVWSGSYFGLLPAVKLMSPKEEAKERHGMMALAHVVWGASLGLLFSRLSKIGERIK